MAIFDSSNDAPNQIKMEGEQVTVTFSLGKPSRGQGTASWNIPAPAHGCKTASEGRGAYCGIVLVLNTVENRIENTPQDGIKYEADPTANRDYHAGDVIGDALVVGAFYEGEKRANGQQLTTSLVVTDLEPNSNYFVTAHAVDCQGRYHTVGSAAYSRSIGNKKEENTPSKQTIALKDGEGVLPTDGTGFVAGKTYKFDLFINDNLEDGKGKTVSVEIDGADAGTYQALIDAINEKVKNVGNPLNSDKPPGAGTFEWDGKVVTQFDGVDHNPIAAIIDSTDPGDIATTAWWVNPTTKELKHHNGTAWSNSLPYAVSRTNPLKPKCDSFWYNGAAAYRWNSTSWCKTNIINSLTDPSLPTLPECGTFWFNTTSHKLAMWKTADNAWLPSSAIYWPTAPNALIDGSYWFNNKLNKLFLRSNNAWVEQVAPEFINDITEPTVTDANTVWYNATTEELNIRDAGNQNWVTVEVLVWGLDPSDTTSCGLWWNSVTEELKVWDSVDNEWDLVNLVQSDNDPSIAPTLEEGVTWYSSETKKLHVFTSKGFKEVNYVDYSTDPTKMVQGDLWFDTSKNTWKQYGTPLANKWNTLNVTSSEVDTSLIPQGTYWFDTAANVLKVRVGTTWASVPYVNEKKRHAKGDIWFNTVTNKLMEWDGNKWVESVPPITVGLDKNGNLEFVSKTTGSGVCLMIPVPGGQKTYGTGFGSDFEDLTQGHIFGHHGDYVDIAPPLTQVTPDEFMFNDANLPGAKVLKVVYGSDGKEKMPAYAQVGVGDDGSPDERRELIDTLRIQLGYPVVDVELTAAQFDIAVTSALESLRKRSSIAYHREYFFMTANSRQQRYIMTSKRAGFNRIVDVITAVRARASMFSLNSGLHGQAVLQDMYRTGTADLVSFHLTAQYLEEMAHMFRPRTTFTWNETTRVLSFFNGFSEGEKVMLECTVERTEQDLLTDRRTKTWIEKYAGATARIILAEIRGKYTQLPGAGGGVTLNAQELITRADQDFLDCTEQLRDFTTDSPDDWGLGSTFIIG